MGIRSILALLAACTALFGVSFAVGGLLKEDEEDVGRTGSQSTSANSTSRLTAEEPSLALGRAAGLPDLRRKPRKEPEPTHTAVDVAPPSGAAASEAEPEPATEPPSTVDPGPPPAAPTTPSPPAPVQTQRPVTPTQPRSSTPDSAPAQPSPDAAPSAPSPGPDPYASGGGGY